MCSKNIFCSKITVRSSFVFEMFCVPCWVAWIVIRSFECFGRSSQSVSQGPTWSTWNVQVNNTSTYPYDREGENSKDLFSFLFYFKFAKLCVRKERRRKMKSKFKGVAYTSIHTKIYHKTFSAWFHVNWKFFRVNIWKKVMINMLCLLLFSFW